MKILIAGCGYVGTALGEELSKSGHEVWGLRRDPIALRALESKGIRAFPADLLSPESLKNIPAVDTAVICQSPSRKSDDYLSTYLHGTKNLLAALPKPMRKIVHISSTSVYSTHDGSWVDESTEPIAEKHIDREAQENAKVLLEAERAVLGSGRPSVVLRLTGIYGEERNRVRSILDGRIQPVLSDVYMNRIHVADIVRAIKLIFEKGESGQVYLGSDDSPSTQKEFYTWMFKQLSKPIPAGAATSGGHAHGASNKRISNQKLKALGLKLRYPSYKEGCAPIIVALHARA